MGDGVLLLLPNGAMDVAGLRAALTLGFAVRCGLIEAAAGPLGGFDVTIDGVAQRPVLSGVDATEAALYFASCWDRSLERGDRPKDPWALT